MRTRLALVAGLSIALVGTAARLAGACHPPKCQKQIVLPGPGRSIPASATSILFYPKAPWGMPPAQLEVQLMKDTAAGKLAVATTLTPRKSGGYEVTPTNGFDPDTTYHLTAPDYCEGSGKLDSTAVSQSFSTAASVALPKQLGTTQLAGQSLGSLTVATVSGMCESQTISAHADVNVILSQEAKPWADLLVYEALVDGKPFSFSSSLAWDLGPFIDSYTKVYTLCTSKDPGVLAGTSPGTHQVTFRATLPGTGLVLEAEPLSLTLTCPARTDDLPPRDGGLPPPGSDSGATHGDPDPTGRSGCSCGLGGDRTMDLPLASLLLLLLLRLRPRERHQLSVAADRRYRRRGTTRS